METVDITKIGLFLQYMLTESKKHIDVDNRMAIATALTMMSTVLGTKVHTYDGSMSKLYSNIWTIIIAQSGLGGKSTTIKTFKNMILKSVIEENETNYTHDIDSFKNLSKEEKKDTKVPQLTQIISGQGSTFQGLIKALEKNPHGMVAIYDEARELLKKLNKDTEHKAGMTSLYDQEYYGKQLVGGKGEGEEVSIHNPYLSILAVTNPRWLIDEVSDSDYESGFLNRFSIIQIDKLPKLIPFKNLKIQDFSKFQNTSLELWKELHSLCNNGDKVILKIDKIADKYIHWFNEKQDKYEHADSNIQSFIIRQLVASLKYAMTIQVYDTVYQKKDIEKSQYLEEKYLDIGIYLAELFIENIEAHIDSIGLNDGGVAHEKNDSIIEKLADKIEKHLTKDEHIDEEYLKSKISPYIRGMKAQYFDETYAYAMEKYDYLKINERKFGNRTVNYYYALSQKNRYGHEDNEQNNISTENIYDDNSIFED